MPQAGRRLGLSRCQQLGLDLPQHTAPTADSELPHNRPSRLSLTSLPGHSVMLRPPRRIQGPVSPSVSARGGRWPLVTAVPLLPPCPQAWRQRSSWQARTAQGQEVKAMGSKGRWGVWVPRTRAREALVSGQLGRG